MVLSTKKQASGQLSNLTAATASSKTSLLFTFFSILLAIFFVYMPLKNALFNGDTPSSESQIFWSFMIGGALALGLAFYFATTKKSIPLLPQLIWLMPLCFLIASIGAVSSYNAHRQLSIWVLYAIFFIAAYTLTKSELGEKSAFYVVTGSASLIMLLGMLNWLGSGTLGGILPQSWSADALQLHEDGMRLTSIFQYANTYAAYLLAYIFVCIAIMTLSNQKVMTSISAAMIVPAWMSFIFTLSRGAWVMVPVVFILVLPLLRLSKQIKFASYFIVSIVISAAALPFINKWGLQLQSEYSAGLAFRSWIVLILACLVLALVTYFGNRYVWAKLDAKLEARNTRARNNLLLPVVAIVLAAIGAFLLLGNTGFTKILPDSIGQRIESINFNQHSVLERAAFYGDALKIWQDYPLFGAGGGAWQALYQQYQDNPYTSTLVHSFIIETLLEVGIIGILCLLVIIVGIYYLFVRSFIQKSDEQQVISFTWFVISTAILLHSLLDFNMSYIYIGVLVFFSLGAMLSIVPLRESSLQQKLSHGKLKLLLPGLLLVVGLIYTVSNMVHLSGDAQFKKTNELYTEQSLQESIEQLDKAISRNGNPNYVDMQLQLLNQAFEQTGDEQWSNKAQIVLDRMSEKEPYLEKMFYRQLDLNEQLGSDIQSIELLQQAIAKMPWEIDYYQRLAATHLRIAVAELAEGNNAEAKEQLEIIFDLMKQIEDKQQQLALLPQEQLIGRDFSITTALARSIGQAHFILGNYEQAEQYLRQAYTGQFTEQEDITAALYYAAVLARLNQDNAAVTAALYAAFPDEQSGFTSQIATLSSIDPLQ